MKICVLMKQVPDKNSSLTISENNRGLEEKNITWVSNESDNYALEEALLIKETHGGEVIACTLGHESANQILKDAMAKGADRSIFLSDSQFDSLDILSLAKVFASVLKDENFDLVLTGLQSDDTGMGQTGVLIGEMLGMSTGTLAMETDVQDNAIRVKRELESGWFQWVKLPLPASISIQSGLNTPRYPSLRGIMGAKKKEIKVVSPSDHQTDAISQSIDKVFVPQTSKQTEMIEGNADSAVTRIIEILKSELKVL